MQCYHFWLFNWEWRRHHNTLYSLGFYCAHCFSCVFFFYFFFFLNLSKAQLPLSVYEFLFISFYFVSTLPNLLNLNQWEFDDATEHVSSFGLLCQNRSQMFVFSDTSPSLICDILSQFVWMHELTHYFLNYLHCGTLFILFFFILWNWHGATDCIRNVMNSFR